ncbi:MAG TPA: peptide MFS transporter [Gammaproteobacteria bacterium]|nr:peptide MFS transporter [Gammaproteobacteria bacterium]
MNTAGTNPPAETWFGHPKGLFTAFMTEMWERFSYYGIRALLMLFMTAAIVDGGLELSAIEAGAIYGLYTGAVYLLALWGGWVADRLLGQQSSIFWGGLVIAAGNFSLAVPLTEFFYLGLALIAVGTGLLKPNVSTIVGELYVNDSGARRDAGFSIFYMGINIGALIAPLITGWVAAEFGYRAAFAVAGVAIALGTFQFKFTSRYLGEAGLHPTTAPGPERDRVRKAFWISAVIVTLIGMLMLFGVIPVNAEQLADITGNAIVIMAVAFFIYVLLLGGLNREEKKRVGVIAVFFVAAAVFFSGFEQAGSSLNLFARDYTDRSFLGSFFSSGEHPAAWYQSINPIMIIVLSPMFAWLWVWLAKRNLEPSAPGKFALGLVQMGLGFGVIAFAAKLAIDQTVAPSWLLLTYLLHTTAELCLSPIGLSNITKLAPRRFVGMMMGTWFMGVSLGNLIAGRFGGEVGAADPASMSEKFMSVMWWGVVAGIIMLALTPWLKKMTGDAR